jgi:predicted ATPase
MKRIVITGGPGAGKTCITSKLASDDPLRFVRVPEASTQVYTALRTRWDKLDLAGRRTVQRKIYALQRLQETEIEQAAANKILLLDRGTIDGAAYWPEGPADYWHELGTTEADELARYDAVIWLQSCAAIGLYDGDESNPCRHEDADTALATGDKLRALWSNHPRLYLVAATSKLEDKLTRVRQILDTLLASASIA